MKKWLTLTGYCLSNYSNALIFGLYADNLNQFADFYNATVSDIQNLFSIGLIIQFLFCLPAIRLIQWRLDYSIIGSAYLTACSSLLCAFSNGNIIIVYAAEILNSIAQLFILPTCFYVAETWFLMEERSLAIGLGFYSNLLGYATGAILTATIVDTPGMVRYQMILVTIINWLIFLGTLSLVRNKPKTKIEKKIKVKWQDIKVLWKKKYTAYNAVALSVFLGISWNFLSSFWLLQDFLAQRDIAILIIIWIASGGGFGIAMSLIMQNKLKQKGNFIMYDQVCKGLIFLGFLGYILVGILYATKASYFYLYAVFMIFIGIGSIGFFGIVFLSLIQSLFPIPALLVSTIVVAFASLYSIMALSLNRIFQQHINYYFSMSIILFFPLIYILITYQTNLKRYKYYLNEKQSKYQLLKIIEEQELQMQIQTRKLSQKIKENI